MSTTSTDASTARQPSDPGRRSADAATVNSAIALRLELLGVPAPAEVSALQRNSTMPTPLTRPL